MNYCQCKSINCKVSSTLFRILFYEGQRSIASQCSFGRPFHRIRMSFTLTHSYCFPPSSFDIFVFYTWLISTTLSSRYISTGNKIDWKAWKAEVLRNNNSWIGSENAYDSFVFERRLNPFKQSTGSRGILNFSGTISIQCQIYTFVAFLYTCKVYSMLVKNILFEKLQTKGRSSLLFCQLIKNLRQW